MADKSKEPAIFLNPLIFKDGTEISCCKLGAKVSAKYMKLFQKYNGKTIKLICKVNYYDPDAETDLEGISIEPVSE